MSAYNTGHLFIIQTSDQGSFAYHKQSHMVKNNFENVWNGDNLIGDNSVISATDKVKIAKKQQVKTATKIEEGREKKKREEKESLINN